MSTRVYYSCLTSFLLLFHRLQVLDEDDFSEEVGSGFFLEFSGLFFFFF